MDINLEPFLDTFRRAFEMEEQMTGALVELCAPAAITEDLPAPTRQTLIETLKTIHRDSLRHEQTLAEILSKPVISETAETPPHPLTITKPILEQRIRQLLAIDLNAVGIYSDLARKVPEGPVRQTLRAIAADEGHHVTLEKKMLSLLAE